MGESEQGGCSWQVGCENGAGIQGWVMGFDGIPEKWGHRLGNSWYSFQSSSAAWVRVPEDLGWKIILVHRETFARLWCHLVWAGEESCWVTDGLVWILLHYSAWAITGFHHSPQAGVFFLPKRGSFHIHRRGQHEVRHYQFPSPATLSLTRIWYSVFRFFQGNPAGSSSFHQSSSSVTHGLCGGTSLRGERGWGICKIEPHKLICRRGFKWQGHWTKRWRVAFNRMYIYFVEPLF